MAAIARTLVLLLVSAMMSANAWDLTWSDEFDGTALNASNWNIRTNESHCCQFGKQELQLYVRDEVSVADGLLHIRTRRRTAVGPAAQGPPRDITYRYTSAWVETRGHFSQRHGRWAANCSLPSSRARGIWPAFWLMPEAAPCWPTGGEIDVMEFNGDPLQDQVFGSYHWAPPGPQNCGKDRAPIPGRAWRPSGIKPHSDWQTKWHTYAIEWDRLGIKFFVDDQHYFTRNASQVDLPAGSMFIILNQAIDPVLYPPTKSHPGEGYDNGVEMRCAWVRVWSGNTTQAAHAAR